MPKISVITPTVRHGGLDLLTPCLNRQTFKDFEWIVATNRFDIWSTDGVKINPKLTLMWSKPKREGDYYSLNKDWNMTFNQARGELIVSIVDLTWIAPDCLEKFWNHYEANPKACISGIGHQYKEVVNGKPEVCVWRDPRDRTDQGTFYRTGHLEIELCCTSFPKQAVVDVGGIDPEFDKYAALSEKDMLHRMTKVGYECYLDQTQEYRALHHERLSSEWEARYQESVKYYNQCATEVIDGKRLKLNYLKNNDSIIQSAKS